MCQAKEIEVMDEAINNAFAALLAANSVAEEVAAEKRLYELLQICEMQMSAA